MFPLFKRMFSLRDLFDISCSVHLISTRAKDHRLFLILITHKSARSENPMTWYLNIALFRTKKKFDVWLKNSRFSVDFVIPKVNCVMMNVITHAKKQVKESLIKSNLLL